MSLSPDITRYCSNLELRNEIWFTKSISSISYPEKGNEQCFQIEENSFWFNHRNNCILAAIKNFPPKGFFFDVGGGNGYVSHAIEQAGYHTVLVEPGINGILNAKNRGLKHLICSTFQDAEFSKNSIPAVGLFDVIEHIEDDHLFLDQIKQYLLPCGRVYITVPAYKFLWSEEDITGGHFRRYTINSLYSLLNETGFIVEYATHIFSILPIPIFMFRTLPFWFHKKRENNPQRCQTEHESPSGSFGKLLDMIWRWELNRVKDNKNIPFGGSCLVIAKANG